jgi:hypothetical protein
VKKSEDFPVLAETTALDSSSNHHGEIGDVIHINYRMDPLDLMIYIPSLWLVVEC